MVNKYILKKESLIFLSLIFTNFGCDIKRDAIGADNEIMVICSDDDKDNVENFIIYHLFTIAMCSYSAYYFDQY